MRQLFSKLTDDDINLCNHDKFKSLLYVIVYLHAVLLDRWKFGKIGFNVSYDFNESDFWISM